ncbi:hypothetical protein N431DRAFT_82666 [Stipitochalara longipes BDJ]|nr:hypothetical protein N431DRAFT_82666 [Stipitochalara longipes BDJ]
MPFKTGMMQITRIKHPMSTNLLSCLGRNYRTPVFFRESFKSLILIILRKYGLSKTSEQIAGLTLFLNLLSLWAAWTNCGWLAGSWILILGN